MDDDGVKRRTKRMLLRKLLRLNSEKATKYQREIYVKAVLLNKIDILRKRTRMKGCERMKRGFG